MPEDRRTYNSRHSVNLVRVHRTARTGRPLRRRKLEGPARVYSAPLCPMLGRRLRRASRAQQPFGQLHPPPEPAFGRAEFGDCEFACTRGRILCTYLPWHRLVSSLAPSRCWPSGASAPRNLPLLTPPVTPPPHKHPEMIGNLIARAPVVHSLCAISDLSGFEVYLPRNGKRFSALLSHLIPYERTEAPA